MRYGLAWQLLKHYRRSALGVTAAAFLGAAGPAAAQELIAPPAVAEAARPAQPVSGSPGLTRCVQIALEKQSAILAARASLDAARAGQAGLGSIRGLPRALAKDLPIREQQASAGVLAKEADVWQTEWDTVANVSRCYWLVVYARQQKALLEDVLKRQKLEAYLIYTDENELLIPSATLRYALATLRARLAEADVGVRRAEALLRESMGVGSECELTISEAELPDVYPPVVTPAPKKGDPPTAMVVLPLSRDAAVSMALDRRGELAQARLLADATDLEIQAQAAILHRLLTSTFASGSDIHTKPVPTADRGPIFKPGAIGPEMPGNFAGKQPFRVERATALGNRAGAVVEKTSRLITLEAEDTFLRLEEATRKVGEGRILDSAGKVLIEKAESLREAPEGSDTDKIKAYVDTFLRGVQARAQQAEYLLLQLSVLAELQRITAGGFCPPFAPASPGIASH